MTFFCALNKLICRYLNLIQIHTQPINNFNYGLFFSIYMIYIKVLLFISIQ